MGTNLGANFSAGQVVDKFSTISGQNRARKTAAPEPVRLAPTDDENHRQGANYEWFSSRPLHPEGKVVEQPFQQLRVRKNC